MIYLPKRQKEVKIMFDYLDKLFDVDGDGELDLTEKALKYGYIKDEIFADSDDDTDYDDDDDDIFGDDNDGFDDDSDGEDW